jgi:cyclopropane-fatty-acyl-phospholipid synthase
LHQHGKIGGMLYKFRSKAAGDVIMLEANGRQVLGIVGKDAGPQGIIEAGQIPAAITALEAAIAKDEDDQKAAAAEASARGEKPLKAEGVSLRQRAVPFLDLLRRSQKEGKDVVWGADAP